MTARVVHPPLIQERLEAGQFFNAYESASEDGWHVGIGPVTDFFGFARCRNPEAADYLVAVLRATTGQPPAISKAAETVDA